MLLNSRCARRPHQVSASHLPYLFTRSSSHSFIFSVTLIPSFSAGILTSMHPAHAAARRCKSGTRHGSCTAAAISPVQHHVTHLRYKHTSAPMLQAHICQGTPSAMDYKVVGAAIRRSPWCYKAGGHRNTDG